MAGAGLLWLCVSSVLRDICRILSLEGKYSFLLYQLPYYQLFCFLPLFLYAYLSLLYILNLCFITFAGWHMCAMLLFSVLFVFIWSNYHAVINYNNCVLTTWEANHTILSFFPYILEHLAVPCYWQGCYKKFHTEPYIWPLHCKLKRLFFLPLSGFIYLFIGWIYILALNLHR